MVLSGAGLSAPSGIQTFRGTTGLWNDHHVDDICNIATWKRNFDIVHQFYSSRREALPTVKPNAGHYMIADWEKRYPGQIINMTQNIDDLLEEAGCQSVVHLHGELKSMKCLACGHVWDIGYSIWDQTTDRCPECNSLRGVKPNVVFFGENAPHYRTLYKQQGQLSIDDTFVVIGTSGIVINVDYLVQTSRVYSILNNLERSESINDASFSTVFYESVETAAEKIDQIIRERMA